MWTPLNKGRAGSVCTANSISTCESEFSQEVQLRSDTTHERFSMLTALDLAPPSERLGHTSNDQENDGSIVKERDEDRRNHQCNEDPEGTINQSSTSAPRENTVHGSTTISVNEATWHFVSRSLSTRHALPKQVFLMMSNYFEVERRTGRALPTSHITASSPA